MAETPPRNSVQQAAQMLLPAAVVRELEALLERIALLETQMEGVLERRGEGLEELRQRFEKLRAEFLQLLGLRHELPSLSDASHLVERHGGQRTVLHTQIAEACAREAEALLGARRRPGRALPRLSAWAQLGS